MHNGGGEVESKEVYILSGNVLLMGGLSAADVKRKACGKFSRCGSILHLFITALLGALQ